MYLRTQFRHFHQLNNNLTRLVAMSNNQTAKKVNQTSLTSFNANHKLYDQVRPDFPAAAVDGLVFDLMNLVPGKSSILEVASGTGKFTKALISRGFCATSSSPLDTSSKTQQRELLVAVEPSQGMITTFQTNFPNNKPPVYQASAYDMSAYISGESFDAVIAAQAFHWFGTRDALKEFARVLVPGGKLGLVWNYEDLDDLDSENWQVKVTNYVWGFDGDVPQYRRMEWTKAFEVGAADGGGQKQYFASPYEELTVRTEVEVPRELIWPYWQSRSYITALPDDKQAEIKQHVEEIVYGEDIPVSDLAKNGKDLLVRRATHVVCATKKA